MGCSPATGHDDQRGAAVWQLRPAGLQQRSLSRSRCRWNPSWWRRCLLGVNEIAVHMEQPAELDIEQLYRDDFVRVVRLAHLLVGSNDAAEDIAQDAFMRVRLVSTEIRDPSAYLTTTVVRLCRNWHRSGRRRTVREQRRAVEAAATDVSGDEVAHHEELLRLVDRLPFRQRTVLVARYWLDLPESEIATLVGCRPGTVKSLASRALRTLRKELQ